MVQAVTQARDDLSVWDSKTLFFIFLLVQRVERERAKKAQKHLFWPKMGNSSIFSKFPLKMNFSTGISVPHERDRFFGREKREIFSKPRSNPPGGGIFLQFFVSSFFSAIFGAK